MNVVGSQQVQLSDQSQQGPAEDLQSVHDNHCMLFDTDLQTVVLLLAVTPKNIQIYSKQQTIAITKLLIFFFRKTLAKIQHPGKEHVVSTP